MRDFEELMKRYEAFKNSHEGSGSDLIHQDKLLQTRRERIARQLKQCDLEIIRNGHEMATTLWPIFLKGEKENENN